MEPSGKDTELSESDDPLEDCQKFFDEFEREAQKKGSDKQVFCFPFNAWGFFLSI